MHTQTSHMHTSHTHSYFTYHSLTHTQIMVTSTINWRESMSTVQDPALEGSGNNKSRGKTVDSHLNQTPDSRSHDPTDQRESSTSDSQLSSSVDPPQSNDAETTPTDTSLESARHTDVNGSSVDPPSVDTPIQSQTSGSV